jgi:hypothetical protein
MPRQSGSQKRTVERVMHEYGHGELKTRGGKVKTRKQAIAIALSEAGASRNKSRSQNRRNRARTRSNERRASTSSRKGRTRAELYAEARRRNIPGRSHMNKAALARALGR